MMGLSEPDSQRLRNAEAMTLLSWMSLEGASVLLPGWWKTAEFFSRIACSMIFFLEMTSKHMHINDERTQATPTLSPHDTPQGCQLYCQAFPIWYGVSRSEA